MSPEKLLRMKSQDMTFSPILFRAKQFLLSDYESLQRDISSVEGQCDELRLARKEDARVASMEKVGRQS